MKKQTKSLLTVKDATTMQQSLAEYNGVPGAGNSTV